MRLSLYQAAELEDEVWHLWLSSDILNIPSPRVGLAAAGTPGAGVARMGDLVKLGSMKFIVDTGCGHKKWLKDICVQSMLWGK